MRRASGRHLLDSHAKFVAYLAQSLTAHALEHVRTTAHGQPQPAQRRTGRLYPNRQAPNTAKSLGLWARRIPTDARQGPESGAAGTNRTLATSEGHHIRDMGIPLQTPATWGGCADCVVAERKLPCRADAHYPRSGPAAESQRGEGGEARSASIAIEATQALPPREAHFHRQMDPRAILRRAWADRRDK